MLIEPELRLRAARREDADFFYALRKEAFLPYFEQVFGPWLDSVQRPIADAELAQLPVEIISVDGASAGYQAIVRHADHWFLDEMALAASFRGRGIGARLVRSMMDGAKTAGLPLRLSVLQVNPARHLYARLGFRIEHARPPRLGMAWP